MQMHWKSISRRLFVACAALLLSVGGTLAFAQNPTSSGTLTVSAIVTGSIQLTFSTATGGVSLVGSNSNSATLSFGTISAYQASTSTVTISTAPPSGLCTSCFSASTPVNFVVSVADSSSSAFNLQGYVTAYSGNEKLSINSIVLGTSSGSPATIASGLSYGPNSETVTLGIPTASSGAATYSDQINIIATAS
jgi:hypothetical protein